MTKQTRKIYDNTKNISVNVESQPVKVSTNSESIIKAKELFEKKEKRSRSNHAFYAILLTVLTTFGPMLLANPNLQKREAFAITAEAAVDMISAYGEVLGDIRKKNEYSKAAGKVNEFVVEGDGERDDVIIATGNVSIEKLKEIHAAVNEVMDSDNNKAIATDTKSRRSI